ncbi:hypothetical protein P152DRAFT_121138 [Eremomyces bilateralis CBS 781.70]|uniref:Uncharacterized protein n=1 Tax=Eremomyces bilateralis CBS 781.70 TaxID=1392243 RepID=A0A6G1GEC1_9PEZI|nr:uncharacterized protein P152DRAFT_121138 [Eremomyces bilateralis CBS 781.70]KAF1816374.1 hypothetical protein P152DRAFT_121138 [Eremomyces bilateralis CBS 781.70]
MWSRDREPEDIHNYMEAYCAVYSYCTRLRPRYLHTFRGDIVNWTTELLYYCLEDHFKQQLAEVCAAVKHLNWPENLEFYTRTGSKGNREASFNMKRNINILSNIR